MIGPHLASGELVPVLEDWTSPSMPIYVVYPPNRRLSAKIRVFVDWMAELFAANNRPREGSGPPGRTLPST
jgi:DNA-binding transcriptional LysR family regulator